MVRISRTTGLIGALVLVLLIVGVGAGLARQSQQSPQRQPAASAGIHKIQHVVIIMQENRSFDSYFGTYPGADGIPMKHGVPTVCLPNPKSKHCVRPYHDRADLNLGGPHGAENIAMVEDGGKMDGFVTAVVTGALHLYPDVPKGVCSDQFKPACTGGGPPDVMGYHTGADLPNYWAYAKNFVLQDHMFEPVTAYSLVSHLYMVSGWSAVCKQPNVARSCTNSLNPSVILPNGAKNKPITRPNYAWTDLTYLLNKNKVSWKYYVDDKTTPYCTTESGPTCLPTAENGTPFLWNQLAFFTTVRQNKQVGNIQGLSHLYADAKAGRLPHVAWVAPNADNSEHGHGLRHRDRQRHHEEPRLEEHRYLPGLG